jgi:hypothetical protein
VRTHELCEAMGETRRIAVEGLDGTSHTFSLTERDTVGTLKRRVGLLIGIDAHSVELCCDGAHLTSAATIASLPGDALTMWTERYSRHRSDAARRQVDLARRQRALDVETMRAHLSASARWLTSIAMRLSLWAWLALAMWLAAFIATRRIGLEGPFLVASATWLVYRFGFSDRKAEEESAYTVFNHGHRALPGQLRGEEVERQMVGGLGGL